MKFFIKMILVVVTTMILANGTLYAEVPAPEKNNHIVGGILVKDFQKEVPWQVALISADIKEPARDQFCGGSVIGTQWILTAAHCVDNFNVQGDPKRVDVIAGTKTYKNGGERLEVSEIYVHPKWNDTGFELDYDAALLHLKTPVTKGQKILLATSNSDLSVGFPVRVSGWGLLTEGGVGSIDLRRVDVPVISNETCNKPDSYDGRVSDQMLCAGIRKGGLDACQGDSGGPAAIKKDGKYLLAGIVSWGYGCAREFKYGIYTRVPTVAKWVSETIAN